MKSAIYSLTSRTEHNIIYLLMVYVKCDNDNISPNQFFVIIDL